MYTMYNENDCVRLSENFQNGKFEIWYLLYNKTWDMRVFLDWRSRYTTKLGRANKRDIFNAFG